MKKDFNIRKIITIREYLNEAYIDQDGNLQDMNFELSSDDLWGDNEFLKFTRENLENGDEMPEKMYKQISDNHKKLYRKELLDYGGQIIAYSENKSLIKDLLKYDYNILEKEILDWVEMYSTFGNVHFPFDELFINTIDEIFQGRIINKLTEVMDWDIDLPNSIFYKFHPRVRKMIEDNDFKPFNMDLEF
jgi:hypothetical protein